MGQNEIYAFLKNNNQKKFTSKNIALNLGVRQNTVGKSLSKLIKYNFIKSNILQCRCKTDVLYWVE